MIDNRDLLKQADPSVLRAACQTVQSAIMADNANWTVTFHLAQAWGPFLDTLAGPWGSILDKEWVIQQNGWNGSCDTWQNYYAMTPEEDPLTSIANGTGPFELGNWIKGEEIQLNRYTGYWRKTPIWSGGPSGPAFFEQVLIKNVADEATRIAMLLNGDADFAVCLSSHARIGSTGDGSL